MSGDRDIKAWDKRLLDQQQRGWDNYMRRRIHLDTARVNELWSICGDYLYVEEVSSSLAEASVAINRERGDLIDLRLGAFVKTVFIQLYLTNDALQGEWIDLIIGINFEYKRYEGAGGGGGNDILNYERQVTWAAANSVSIPFGNNATSDIVTFSQDLIDAKIELKADNDGTPAAGDTVDFFLRLTCGDPDGAGADEYDTVGHAIFLAQLDTNTEDPAIRTVDCPWAKGARLYAVNNSAGRAITVSACILEKRCV